MRTFYARFLRITSSLAQGLADAAEMGTSLLMNRDATKTLTPSNYAVSYLFGILTGIVTGVTHYNFQGREIQKRITNDQRRDSQTEEELAAIETQPLSLKRKSSYLLIKYGYIGMAIIVDYLALSFLYSATKAWVQDLKEGDDTPLTFVSHSEGLAILLYYTLFDLPMVVTTGISQTCTGISNMMDVLPHEAPDKFVMKKLFSAVRPIAASNVCRKLIRGSGTLTDTVEHVLPLIILIPPSVILSIMNSPAIIAWGAAGISLVVLGIVSGTILTQTYLFEGRFSEQNLRWIASKFGEELGDEAAWVSPRVANIFHKLLYLGGPLHGCDNGLSVSLTLKEVSAPASLIAITTPLFFGISWAGNHWSEVKESQDELEEITLPRESTLSNSRHTQFFARGYGTLNNDPEDMKPIAILNNAQSLNG
ncbi:MAG: hypothetical protein H0U71_02320 [Gammaproteobacteria bacterium]|nr:hypothetical protein [Gammaproteobacteria bacterium]